MLESRVIVVIPRLKTGFSFRIPLDFSGLSILRLIARLKKEVSASRFLRIYAFDVRIPSNRSNPEAGDRFSVRIPWISQD